MSIENTYLEVRESQLHGKGAFAKRHIPAGTVIIEYKGEIVPPEEVDNIMSHTDDPDHTFTFSLSTGAVIDGGVNGNDARWINHSCEPNCEAHEDDDNRVWIRALKDIEPGTELTFDYKLCIDEPFTDSLKQRYKCLCGSPSCRHTMLDLNYTPDLFGQRAFQQQALDELADLRDQVEQMRQNQKYQTKLMKLIAQTLGIKV